MNRTLKIVALLFVLLSLVPVHAGFAKTCGAPCCQEVATPGGQATIASQASACCDVHADQTAPDSAASTSAHRFFHPPHDDVVRALAVLSYPVSATARPVPARLPGPYEPPPLYLLHSTYIC